MSFLSRRNHPRTGQFLHTNHKMFFCFVCVSQQLFISKRLFASNLADSLVGHRVATQKFGGRHGDLDQGWDKCDTKRQRDADAFNFDVTVTVYVIFASSSEFDGDLILA